ncbi:MAG: class I mannose-6-phosphate isomerase [Bacteroidaceae bacterium]|nr:class I mannose-6-phosphate isomerase [Bacteroidaceae bacterium]MBQ8936991.1 class I mannose-6-phosphate isomerase [Bacteroidaceae bacterium]MBQ9190549.1 class I mannose-6-phosphate isomerase [Bacteroidaceae bacterium]MBR0244030.1 class I mannose-6-phosphate isomerase [Bacteroidaceae bacterium]MBR1791186.1 class I mannose-6-phosphate isomerase [Bacteroidaceae bacterium]
MYPLLFRENLHEIVWGGSRLKALKGLPADGRNIGESWEISAVRGSESVVQNGELAGSTLGELVQRYGAELMGKHIAEAHGTEFPLLVKFIDAAGDLSIQVHPGDELARARHGKLGKTEMWYVMDARPGATLLAGFKKQIRPEEYAAKVADGSIVDVLARHKVHPGDVFFIPAGRVHAICRGILLCEIQQSSDVTYRLYDYNRLGLDGKPRQLHTEEARDAIDYKVYDDYRTHYQPVAEGAVRIVDCPFFVVNVVATSSSLHRNLLAEDSFVTLSCLSGACTIQAGGVSVSLGTGNSCLIPASVADFEVTAFGNREVRLLESWAR